MRFVAKLALMFAVACSARVLPAQVAASPSTQGEIIDSIVAVVNGDPVLASDWESAVRYEAMLEGRKLQDVTPDQQRATLQRLIDRTLIAQQMRGRNLQTADQHEIDAAVKQLRQQVGVEADSQWTDLLKRYVLSEDQLRQRVAAQVNMLKFVEAQIRPSIRVGDTSIRMYYRDKFTPELRAQGGAVPPLQQVSDKIRQILAEQQVDTQLDAWLRDLRRSSNVRFRVQHAAASVAGTQATTTAAGASGETR